MDGSEPALIHWYGRRVQRAFHLHVDLRDPVFQVLCRADHYFSGYFYKQRAQLKQALDLGLQVGRNVVHFAGQYAWTVGVASLPLVKVFALEFTTPIWVSLLAFLFLKERLSTARVLAAIGGFIGVLVVLRPGFDSIEPAALIVLLAAVGYATSIIMVKKLTLTSSPAIIVIWMVLLQLPLGFGLSLAQWRTPTLECIPWILLLGVTGLSAHFAMAKALSVMDASIAIPIDFFRVPLIAVVGFFLYGESLEIWVLVGALTIFASNYLAFRIEQKTKHPGLGACPCRQHLHKPKG